MWQVPTALLKISGEDFEKVCEFSSTRTSERNDGGSTKNVCDVLSVVLCTADCHLIFYYIIPLLNVNY